MEIADVNRAKGKAEPESLSGHYEGRTRDLGVV